MTGNINSTAININQIVVFAMQAIWTGSPVGTLAIQGSNDYVATAADVVNWSTLSNTQVTVNGAGNFLWNATEMGMYWVRLVYTFTSGSGTLTANFVGKGV